MDPKKIEGTEVIDGRETVAEVLARKPFAHVYLMAAEAGDGHRMAMQEEPDRAYRLMIVGRMGSKAAKRKLGNYLAYLALDYPDDDAVGIIFEFKARAMA